jgi:hypothetical protein
MGAAERHDAVRRVAAAEPPRHDVRRVTGERPQTRQPRPATLRRCPADAGTRGVATTARGLLGPGLVAGLRLRLMEV